MMQTFMERAGLITEGQCPEGHGPLRREDDRGWCLQCDKGYAVRRATPEQEWMCTEDNKTLIVEHFSNQSRPDRLNGLEVWLSGSRWSKSEPHEWRRPP